MGANVHTTTHFVCVFVRMLYSILLYFNDELSVRSASTHSQFVCKVSVFCVKCLHLCVNVNNIVFGWAHAHVEHHIAV